MAMQNGRTPFIKTDRFGQPYQAIRATKNESGFYKGFVELAGKLYVIEFGEQDQVAEKGRYQGQPFRWVRVTKRTDPKSRPQSM